MYKIGFYRSSVRNAGEMESQPDGFVCAYKYLLQQILFFVVLPDFISFYCVHKQFLSRNRSLQMHFPIELFFCAVSANILFNAE